MYDIVDAIYQMVVSIFFILCSFAEGGKSGLSRDELERGLPHWVCFHGGSSAMKAYKIQPSRLNKLCLGAIRKNKQNQILLWH